MNLPNGDWIGILLTLICVLLAMVTKGNAKIFFAVLAGILLITATPLSGFFTNLVHNAGNVAK